VIEIANKLGIALFLVIFSTALYMTTADWIRGKNMRRSTVVELREVLRKLPFSESATISKSFDKDVSVAVSAKLATPLPLGEVVATFKSEMPESGWLLTDERDHPYVSLTYCRDGVAAVIEPTPAEQGTTAYMTVKWTYQTGSPDYCA